MTPTRLAGLGVALAASVLLTGCNGVAALNPGVAVQVGDDTISMSRVDDLTDAYCSAAETQFEEGQTYANHYLRGLVASSITMRSAADQFATEQGVTADPSYQKAVDRFEPSLTSLTDEQKRAVIDVQLTNDYVQAVSKSVGAQLGATSPKAQVAQGTQAFQDWLTDQDVRIDPRLGVSVVDGTAKPADTSLSFALSDTATTSNADQPDTDYAGALPGNQRCG